MATAFYRIGTVAVTQNSKVVTGTGTNWNTGPIKPLIGDVFIFNNKIYEIEHIISDTEIRLYRNFEDATASAQTYVIMRNASLNISARIAAQVAQVVNQKQIMIDEFHEFLTNNTDPTVPLTDTLGNTINVIPIPMLNKDYVAKVGGIDAAVTKAVADINKAFDDLEYPLMQENQAEAIKDANKNLFAASGMVHNGKHHSNPSGGLINEGMSSFIASSSNANTLYMGRQVNNQSGLSKTEYPVTHIAGVVSNLRTSLVTTAPFSVYLPPAPDGTVIYDSTGDARGTGKANLNLLTEVDPKYGDIPSGPNARNEAVARAFEGSIKNGDFRDGDVSWLKTGGTVTIDTTGADINADTGNAQVTSTSSSSTTGVHTIEVYVDSITSGSVYAFYNINGGTYSPNIILKQGWNKVTVTDWRNDGSSTALRVKCNTGSRAKVTYVSVKPSTEEVVTDRVDMFGLEQFDMVMKDGEIFDMVQSQSTTFGTSGVPTVVSTRPDSFFAVYAGQQNIVKGRCVRWPDLNRAQKRHIAKYMKERLYLNEEGNVTFSTIRQRSFAGTGNGDWRAVESGARDYLSYASSLYPKPQGSADLPLSGMGMGEAAEGLFSGEIGGWGTNFASHDKGIYTAVNSYADSNGIPSIAYKGRCFFYVLGTVSRLNQGAYHPSLNASGANQVFLVLNGQISSNKGNWNLDSSKYGTSPFITGDANTKADCFGKYAAIGVYGAIGGLSGRPDGRLYDAIYADGLGGVVDRRLSAYPMESGEEFAKAWEKVKNGTYRGLEKLVWTEVGGSAVSGSNKILLRADGSKSSVGDIDVSIPTASSGRGLVPTNGAIYKIDGGVVTDISNRVWGSGDVYISQGDLPDTATVVIRYKTKTSVSGNFTMTDVIGDPAKIVQVDALKNGWQGSWIPDFTGRTQQLSRKAISTPSTWLKSDDGGVSWGTATFALDSVNNSVDGYMDTTPQRVGVLSYTAFAKQTKPSTNKPVLNGEAGVGSVLQMSNYYTFLGSLLGESMLGVICKASTGTRRGTLALNSISLNENVLLQSSGANGQTEHSELTLSAPNNDSKAFKALPYQISDNGQASIGVQANELTYGSPTYNSVQESNTTWTATERYVVTSGDMKGHYRCNSSFGYALTNGDVFRGLNGDIYKGATGVRLLKYLGATPNGWGDDSTMKITASGSDTFVDLNGNTNLSVAHELALPIGWTKNRARVGTQVLGVDL